MNAVDYLSVWAVSAAAHLDLFGSLGLCLGFTAGIMPRRDRILLASAACAAAFGIHYLTLGALTGTAMCAISVLQSLVALTCLGRPVRHLLPVVPIADRVRLGFAVLSYCDSLVFGITADGSSTPDVDVLAAGVADAWRSVLARA